MITEILKIGGKDIKLSIYENPALGTVPVSIMKENTLKGTVYIKIEEVKIYS